MAGSGVLRLDLDVGAHALEDAQDSGPGRVDADPVEHDLRAGNDRTGDQEEGSRGDVSRDLDLVELQVRAWPDGDPAVATLDPGPGCFEHDFGVVAGGQRFDHRGRTFGPQTGDQQA